MYILGIYQGHDANAALISDDKIIAAAQEERFLRKKHFCGFPFESVKFVIKQAGISPSKIKYVACPHDSSSLLLIKRNQYRKEEKRNIYFRVPDKAARDRALRRISRKLKEAGVSNFKEIINLDHHLAHASCAYRCCGWQEATVITLDGSGNNLSGSVYHGKNGSLKSVAEITSQGSLGWFYSAVTEALGFRPGDEEGKAMSLAAYGRSNSSLMSRLKMFAPDFKGLSLSRAVPWSISAKVEDGFYNCRFKESKEIRRLVDKFGRENVAACAQRIIEQKVKALAEEAVRITGSGRLAVAGGVFLNVRLNMLLEEAKFTREIRPHPAAGDSGLALGAALEALNRLAPKKKIFYLDNAYLGPAFSNNEILSLLKGGKFMARTVAYKEIPGIVSDYLRKGLAVGWFQGRMEYGPRALGARSVLLDPRNIPAMKRLNLKLKKREWFMPFAPAILREQMRKYVKGQKVYSSPFMLKAYKIKKEKEGELAACMHVDGTIRAQTVSRKQNPLYYDTIKKFYKDTGVAGVLNTSFNRHGLPIVCSPQDALRHLKMKCVDVLVMNNIIAENSR